MVSYQFRQRVNQALRNNLVTGTVCLQTHELSSLAGVKTEAWRSDKTVMELDYVMSMTL